MRRVMRRLIHGRMRATIPIVRAGLQPETTACPDMVRDRTFRHALARASRTVTPGAKAGVMRHQAPGAGIPAVQATARSLTTQAIGDLTLTGDLTLPREQGRVRS